MSTTPQKGGKKKEKRSKKGTVNGEKEDDRASPEVNAQEQMAAQRASGGVIDAPPEEVSHILMQLSSLNNALVATSLPNQKCLPLQF